MQLPATVVRTIGIAFLDHAHGLAIDGLVANIVLRSAAVPLAGDEGLIARRIEGLRHDVLAEVEAARVIHAGADGVAARLQTSTRHAAHRCGIEALHADAARAKAIHVRRVDVNATWISVIADVAPTLVIGNDNDDVRWRCRRDREGLGSCVAHAVGDGRGEVGSACCGRSATEGAAGAERDSRGQRATRNCPRVAHA